MFTKLYNYSTTPEFETITTDARRMVLASVLADNEYCRHVSAFDAQWNRAGKIVRQALLDVYDDIAYELKYAGVSEEEFEDLTDEPFNFIGEEVERWLDKQEKLAKEYIRKIDNSVKEFYGMSIY